MPGMSGPELREHLRELLPTVRVLYMSGYTHDEIAKRGFQAETHDLVNKPFTIATLLRRVQETLEETHHQHGSP